MKPECPGPSHREHSRDYRSLSNGDRKLHARLAFLKSRVNWQSDPTVQSLIADTEALHSKPKSQ